MTEHDQTSPTPAELHGIESALDALASSERRAAPTGFEQRLADATMPTMPAAPAPPVVVRRIGFPRVITTMRLAAMVALCGGVLAVWIARHAAPVETPAHDEPRIAYASGSLEDDFELIMAVRRLGIDSVDERIDVLFSDTAAVRDSLSDFGSGLLEGESL